MLVLSRKTNEEIWIEELGIKIVVLRQDGNSVRIGIDAPKEIRILRGELAEFKMNDPVPVTVPVQVPMQLQHS